MRTYWRTVLGITLTVAVITELAAVLIQGLFLDDALGAQALDDPAASASEVLQALGDAMLALAAVSVIVR